MDIQGGTLQGVDQACVPIHYDVHFVAEVVFNLLGFCRAFVRCCRLNMSEVFMRKAPGFHRGPSKDNSISIDYRFCRMKRLQCVSQCIHCTLHYQYLWPCCRYRKRFC